VNPFFRNSRFNFAPSLACSLLVVALAAAPMTGHTAQSKPGPKADPSSPAVKGRSLFGKNCAACHGSSGQGGEGPNLHGLTLSDERITSIVTAGIKNEMPAFKSTVKDQDVKALIAYLRTLKK
jgi:mono/diheme cytochrome c family protein